MQELLHQHGGEDMTPEDKVNLTRDADSNNDGIVVRFMF